MFGLDNNEKELKELLAQLGCEASVFKNFKAAYEKVEKRYTQVESKLGMAINAGNRVESIAREIEQHFTSGKAVDISGMVKELKKMQGDYVHEFLVSSQDHEFASTYSTIIARLPGVERNPGDRLLLQSEVENLISMIHEKLGQPKPNLYAYTYFLNDHKDEELFELNAEARCERVSFVYMTEVVHPVVNAVAASVNGDSSRACFMPRFTQIFSEMTGGMYQG